jgi:hypothetical protein
MDSVKLTPFATDMTFDLASWLTGYVADLYSGGFSCEARYGQGNA